MTNLEVIREAFDKVNVIYVIKQRRLNDEEPLYTYLFIAGNDKTRIENTEIEHLIAEEYYMEFDENGHLVAY